MNLLRDRQWPRMARPGRRAPLGLALLGVLAWCVLMAPMLFLGACGDPFETPLLASTTPPDIRVRIGSPEPRKHVAAPPGGWIAESLAGGTFRASGTDAFSVDFRAGPSGIRWGNHDTGATSLRLRFQETYSLGAATYDGLLLIHQQGDGLLLVGELDLETYVAGVVGNEMGPDRPAAAYRAQAIAARTYAFETLRRPGSADRTYHVRDSAHSQVFRGRTPLYGADYEQAKAAAAGTRGVILMHGSRVLPAYYSSTCAGHTTDAKTSDLDPRGADAVFRGVPCNWCRHSKYYRWEPSPVVSDRRLFDAFKRDGRPLSAPIHAIEVLERGAGGWLRKVRITYGPNRRTRDITGQTFRRLGGARSHHIRKIERVADGWRITGGGWGHGVGMCQMGAIGMAKAGTPETEILRYYYPGATLYAVY